MIIKSDELDRKRNKLLFEYFLHTSALWPNKHILNIPFKLLVYHLQGNITRILKSIIK